MTASLDPPDRVFLLRTRWSDADAQGVLNNAVYLTLFEEGRRALCEEIGVLDGEGNFPFLLAQTTVSFLRPGRGGVEVQLELATTRLGKSSFEQRYRVCDGATGEAWCEGQAVLVCYDPATGRSRPMEADFRAALAATIRGAEGAAAISRKSP